MASSERTPRTFLAEIQRLLTSYIWHEHAFHATTLLTTKGNSLLVHLMGLPVGVSTRPEERVPRQIIWRVMYKHPVDPFLVLELDFGVTIDLL